MAERAAGEAAKGEVREPALLSRRPELEKRPTRRKASPTLGSEENLPLEIQARARRGLGDDRVEIKDRPDTLRRAAAAR